MINLCDTETSFSDLSITHGIILYNIYDKQEVFNLEIVNYPFHEGGVPRALSYGVYMSQLIRFGRIC